MSFLNKCFLNNYVILIYKIMFNISKAHFIVSWLNIYMKTSKIGKTPFVPS